MILAISLILFSLSDNSTGMGEINFSSSSLFTTSSSALGSSTLAGFSERSMTSSYWMASYLCDFYFFCFFDSSLLVPKRTTLFAYDSWTTYSTTTALPRSFKSIYNQEGRFAGETLRHLVMILNMPGDRRPFARTALRLASKAGSSRVISL